MYAQGEVCFGMRVVSSQEWNAVKGFVQTKMEIVIVYLPLMSFQPHMVSFLLWKRRVKNNN